MWQSHKLQASRLNDAIALLAAVAPNDVVTFQAFARSWLKDREQGLLLLETKSCCTAGLVFFRHEPGSNQLTIRRCRHVEIGRPDTTVKALLDAFLDLASENDVGRILINETASNNQEFAVSLDGPCGLSFGFHRIQGGWVSELPSICLIAKCSPLRT